jgi:hypothetical protein
MVMIIPLSLEGDRARRPHRNADLEAAAIFVFSGQSVITTWARLNGRS